MLDRYGDVVTSIDGAVSGEQASAKDVERQTRHRGPVMLRPSVWIIDDRRLIEFATADVASTGFTGRTDITYLVGRSR